MDSYFIEILLILTVVMTTKQGVYSLDCIQWTSSRDGKYRSHCYEYLQGTNNSTFEAEAICKMSGGQLAPFVDEFQFNFWRDFLPTLRSEIIIGVNDLVQEGVWTSFDGTPVDNLPWNPRQPNGGRDQNCVVINAEPPGYSVGEPFKLQDKDCTETFDGFLCYRDALCFTNCEGRCWTDCFWFISQKANWTFHGANAQCKEQDGVLASVASFKEFEFLKNAFLGFQSYTGIRSAWLGVHFIDGQYRNVNGDDFPVDVLYVTSDPPEDSCLQFGQKSVLYNDLYSFHSCDTSGSMAGICTRSKLGFRWYTEKTSTSDAYIRNALKIDKSETTTEIIKRISASDERASSTGIGYVGVSVIIAVMTFVVILDCGQRQKIDEKKKRKRHVHITSHYKENIRGRGKMTTKV